MIPPSLLESSSHLRVGKGGGLIFTCGTLDRKGDDHGIQTCLHKWTKASYKIVIGLAQSTCLTHIRETELEQFETSFIYINRKFQKVASSEGHATIASSVLMLVLQSEILHFWT